MTLIIIITVITTRRKPSGATARGADRPGMAVSVPAVIVRGNSVGKGAWRHNGAQSLGQISIDSGSRNHSQLQRSPIRDKAWPRQYGWET
jgi:hypothetical protein